MIAKLRPFWLAMTLLSVLPVGRALAPPITARELGASVAWYSWVGAVIGAALWGAAALTDSAPVLLQAALMLAIWAALTGGLHLDGLADSVDGLAAYHGDADRTLAVMREPTAGPMAIVAIVLVLMLKMAALASLIAAGAPGLVVWVGVPVVARGAATGLMATTAYRRREGIARDQAAMASGRAITASLGLAAAMLAVMTSIAATLTLIVIAVAVTWLWRRAWRTRIGGYTGDIAGALIELVEAALLIGLAWGGADLWG